MTIIRITGEQPNLSLMAEELKAVPGLAERQIQLQATPTPARELGHADWASILIDLGVGTASGVLAGTIVEAIKAVVANARRRGQVELELPAHASEGPASAGADD
jgi:hypothetical protein